MLNTKLLNTKFKMLFQFYCFDHVTIAVHQTVLNLGVKKVKMSKNCSLNFWISNSILWKIELTTKSLSWINSNCLEVHVEYTVIRVQNKYFGIRYFCRLFWVCTFFVPAILVQAICLLGQFKGTCMKWMARAMNDTIWKLQFNRFPNTLWQN